MAEYLLRPKARKDLEGIWVYTYETWGEDQANSYIYDLDNGFQALAAKPEKGLPCDDIREGYCRYLVGKHIIYYKVIKKGIEVVRILHQRMDPDYHFWNHPFKFPTRDYVVDGGTPLAITSGDYNHSGMSDIVVASNAKNTIEIYLQRRVFK